MTPATLAAFALLLAGVAVSLRTRVPGVVFSLAGVYLYWWETGYTEPGTVTLVLLTSVVVLVLAGRAFDRFISARVGGASTTTATVGGFVGAVAFAFLGTTGLVLGTIVTVFVLEFLRRRDAKRSFVAALAVVFGTFASTLIQLLMAVLILLVMAAVAL
jgi:uncharacterized protein YqgC (DUF456 family)